MKKVLRIIGGGILFPLYLAMYLYDRIICVPLLWITHDNMLTWLRSEQKITHSLIRVVFVGIIHFLIWVSL